MDLRAFGARLRVGLGPEAAKGAKPEPDPLGPPRNDNRERYTKTG